MAVLNRSLPESAPERGHHWSVGGSPAPFGKECRRAEALQAQAERWLHLAVECSIDLANPRGPQRLPKQRFLADPLRPSAWRAPEARPKTPDRGASFNDLVDWQLHSLVLQILLALLRHPIRQGIGEHLWLLEEGLVAALLEDAQSGIGKPLGHAIP